VRYALDGTTPNLSAAAGLIAEAHGKLSAAMLYVEAGGYDFMRLANDLGELARFEDQLRRVVELREGGKS
jgi:hypothetical protein